MKTLKQQTLSIILSMIMILSCFAGTTFSVGADDVTDMKKTVSTMAVGDTFTFGSYPQTDVTSELGSELTAAAPSTDEWIINNYYYNGKESDYMKYYDLSYNGSRYRGVYFISYRWWNWDITSAANQSENGYGTNNVYWFRYDPLTWRILDPSTGYVICEDIIDSKAFNDKYYTNGTRDAYGKTAYYNDKTYTHLANNWEYSTIRTWLNESFFVTAFSASERSQIPCTKLITPAYSTSHSAYDVGETGDYVFLTSYQDMLNSSYGFLSDYSDSDMNRSAHSSDYAKSQGVYVNRSDKDKNNKYTSYYWLRSAGDHSFNATVVNCNGYIHYDWYTHDTGLGIRPALCFNPSSTLPTNVHTEVTIEGKAPTCTEKGLTDGVKCSVCGEILKAQKDIPALGHKEVKIAGKSATCTEKGLTDGVKCSVCGEILSAQKEIPALGHKEVKIKSKAPTCTEKGLTEGTKCSVCGKVLTEQKEIPALGHKEVKIEGKSATCTEKGISDGAKCSVCGKVITEQKEIPTLGHKEVKIEGKSATCTEKGLTDGAKCSVCGGIITAQKEIPALGHKEVKIEGKSAACTEKGLTDGAKCSVCGEILTAQTEIPALGHSYKDGVCTVCGAIDPDYKLMLNSDSKLILSEDKAMVFVIPESTGGMTAGDFKSQFTNKNNISIDDSAIITNGLKFNFGDTEYSIIVKGDANADGKISAADARAILRIAARLEQPDDVTKESADIDSDGKVTSKEARSVLRFAARLQSKIYE